RSQAVVSTLIWGILLGNIQLGTILSMIAILPGILFAMFGAKYTGKYGAKGATVAWSAICLTLAGALTVFCLVFDMGSILESLPLMIVFFALSRSHTAASMSITVASGATRADIIAYQLARSGKYLPAAVAATYNVIDHLISSLGASVALGAVALTGYTDVMPQPTDEPTTAILLMTLGLFFGLPMFGWAISLLAMRGYKLDREERVRVQRRVSD